jgi:hypothetical protein
MMTLRALGLALLAAALSTGAAHADRHCDVPMADWQPREALQQKLADKGWQVQRIRTDDGCYKVHALDEQGRRVEVKIDPATLEIVAQKGEERHGPKGEGRHGPGSEEHGEQR